MNGQHTQHASGFVTGDAMLWVYCVGEFLFCGAVVDYLLTPGEVECTIYLFISAAAIEW